MIDGITKIVDVINAFHDGEMLLEQEEGNHIVLKIECEYLAEMVNSNFNFFWIKIYNCYAIVFNPWFISQDFSKEIWTVPREIFQTALEILSAEIDDGKIKIYCNQDNADFNFKGGELLLDCQSIEVFDQEWNRLEYLTLKEMTNKYWKKI